MSPRWFYISLPLCLLLVTREVESQPPRNELEQLRRPTTVAGLWSAIKSEVAVGKFDTAAAYLKELLALEPSEKDLVQLEERDGIAAFLELNSVPRWSSNEALDREARNNVKELLARVTKAVTNLRSNPERIQRYIRNLTATPEERDYALIELRKAGPAAMPFLIGSLISADLKERSAIVNALKFLDADTVPALLASFDVPSNPTRVELLDVLASRRDLLELTNRTVTDPRPTLWKLAAGNDLVAAKAKQLLASLTNTPLSRLPLSVGELVKAANDLYQHRNTFAREGGQVTLWRWVDNKLISQTVTPSQAEEYFGLRYARWALELEPQNENALTVYLSLAADKALERVPIGTRLAQASPEVHEMMAVAPARIIYRLLDRALKEDHQRVALAAIQVIGERAEVHDSGRFEPLLRALHSQDRRLAIEAADALIHLPSDVGPRHSSRIVEVYRAALAGGLVGEAAGRRPRVLIGESNELRAQLMSDLAERAGWDVVVASTGRETIQRLAAAADIDSVWLSGEIVYPTLPDLLSQVRADYRFGRLPTVVYIPIDVAKGRLPEINGLLDRLEFESRGWLTDDTNLSAAVKAAQANGDSETPKVSNVRKLLEVDRSRYPLRVELRYDALKLASNRVEQLDQWLNDLSKRHPTVRRIKQQQQRILITIERKVPGLDERLDTLSQGIPGAVSRRVSDSLFQIDLPADNLPDLLADRLGKLLRDFGNEVIDDTKYRVLHVERQILTRIILTTLPETAIDLGSSGANGKSPQAEAVGQTSHYDPDVERDKIYRQIDVHAAARWHALIHRYPGVLLVAEPLNPGEFLAVQRHVTLTAAAPLSDAEVKDHRRRAIEALRQMALGILPGYDVRPAAKEILQATRFDDLTSAAIDAAGRLATKDVQFALAEIVVNTQRPANVRRQAATQLTRQIQQFGVTSITNPQIATFLRLLDDKDPDVRASVAAIIGSLPRDRVLGTFSDAKAKAAWTQRFLQYEPRIEPPAAPMKQEQGKEEPKTDN